MHLLVSHQSAQVAAYSTADDKFDHLVKVVTTRSFHCKGSFFSFVVNKLSVE